MGSGIVLCSGGIDSVVTAFHIKRRLNYKKLIVLFFDYGQRSLYAERKYSRNCARDINARFIEVKLNWLGKISGSLINKKGKFKKTSRKDLKDTKKTINDWYVPFRNTIFLSYALALAESEKARTGENLDIFTGFKNEGREAYPDTTKEYLAVFNTLQKEAGGSFRIIAPLIEKDKEDIILLGKELGVDFRKTFSCYTGGKEHCGVCLACRLRQEGFYWADIKDPTKYKNKLNDFRTA